MRKTITSIIAMVAMLFASNAMAQETFKGAVDQYTTTDYSRSNIDFSLSDVAKALDTDTATLVAALDAWIAYEELSEEEREGVEPVASMVFDTPNDTVYSDNYTQGGAGGFWMDVYGQPVSWGTTDATWFNTFAYSASSDLLRFSVGQYPSRCKEDTTYTTTIVLVYNEKKVNFEIALNVVPRPKLDKDPVYWYSKLEIVDTKEIAVSQYPRSNWASDPISFDVAGLADKFGLDPEIISLNLSNMLYAKAYDKTNEVITDSLTNQFTATPNPGFWYKDIRQRTGCRRCRGCSRCIRK